MEADTTPGELPSAGPAAPSAWPEVTTRQARRTSRVIAVMFALFLLLLGEIALTGSPPPASAAYPHSLRAVTGEGCGGG